MLFEQRLAEYGQNSQHLSQNHSCFASSLNKSCVYFYIDIYQHLYFILPKAVRFLKLLPSL